MISYHDPAWIRTGRDPIKEKGFWTKLFCFHPELPGQPRMTSKHYSDIIHVQCEKCGRWHSPSNMRSQAGGILKAMFTGNNSHALRPNEYDGEVK